MPRKFAVPGAFAALALLGVCWFSQLGSAPFSAASVTMPQATSFLIVLGVGDKTSTVWDGGVTLSGGQILDIQGWRFNNQDSTDRKTSWKARTRTMNAGSGQQPPMAENGVIVSASISSSPAVFDVSTPAGRFSFSDRDIEFGGGKSYLNGRAAVERVPPVAQLTNSPEEQDFPAIAESGDDVWVSYVQFVHGDRSEDVGSFKTEPADLDFLARPVGGDQVFLLQYSKSKRIWSEPVAVTAGGQDVMRTAVAVDGQKRVWVFWSAQRDGSFDLYARQWSDGRFGNRLQLTSAAGPDLNPVAATDRSGRVWVAWQGYRNGNFEILATAQQGDGFTPEHSVSTSPRNDWDPAIAASSEGDIAIAWDTYDKGDYDVWFRRVRWESGGVRMAEPVAAARSAAFEARPSIGFDPQNRLWIAYETADIKWGKDFGAYETSGTALYQGHNVEVACFQGPDRYMPAAVGAVLPSAPSGQLFPRKFGAGKDPVFPDPSLAEKRKPNGGPGSPAMPLNSFPRLAVDAAGKVYLAFRTNTGAGRSGVGTVWHGEMTIFDGAKWTAPLILPRTDGLLDSRPALAPLGTGQLLAVYSGDHRLSPLRVAGGDPVNADLFVAEVIAPAPRQSLQLASSPLAAVGTDSSASDEADMIAAIRGYRTNLNGVELRLLRGEFHRHTEISGDGGRDGPVIDAYRYFLDAASMDWAGCCDHDNGGGREYNWWIEQKLNDAYNVGERFVSMFAYERSVSYPEGHRNVVFSQRGIRPLPRLPKMADNSPATPAPDTRMLYRYLALFDGVAASHTSGTDMGTDWRDNDPIREPVVEIYQGDRQNYEMPGAPRSNSASDSIGGWRPAGFVSLALGKGYRLGFQSSSDHISTHMSYCNLFVSEPTRKGVMEALKKRRVYGSTDNILADVRSGDHLMGEEFSTGELPSVNVNLWGTNDFASVQVVKDGAVAYSLQPAAGPVSFVWRDNNAQRGRTSYYYVRAQQVDGELVWVSPMWIRYQ